MKGKNIIAWEMAEVNLLIKMERIMKDNDLIIKWMVKEHYFIMIKN